MALEVETKVQQDYAGELKAKFRAHTAVVAVVGIGYVGLPLAVEKAKVAKMGWYHYRRVTDVT